MRVDGIKVLSAIRLKTINNFLKLKFAGKQWILWKDFKYTMGQSLEIPSSEPKLDQIDFTKIPYGFRWHKDYGKKRGVRTHLRDQGKCDLSIFTFWKQFPRFSCKPLYMQTCLHFGLFYLKNIVNFFLIKTKILIFSRFPALTSSTILFCFVFVKANWLYWLHYYELNKNYISKIELLFVW